MNAQMHTKDGNRSPSSPANVLHRLRTKQLLVCLLAISLLLLLPPRRSILDSERWRRSKIVELSASAQEPGGMRGSSSSSLVQRQQQAAVSCDLTRGKWVRDPSWPLYTAESCKPWLSQPWACSSSSSSSPASDRDMSYEQYRWQPHGCDLPKFDGQVFLHRMANKTIAFIGDSLGRQQYQSLMCILTSSSSSSSSSPQQVDETSAYNLGQAGTANRFLSTNTTVLYFWSSALCQVGPPEPSLNGSSPLHLDRVDSFLEEIISKLDVLVVNTGHHWNRVKLQQNKWELHLAGKPMKRTRRRKRPVTVGQARRTAITTVVAWLHEEVARRPGLTVFARTLSPRHFIGGEWDTGGKCDSTVRHALNSSGSKQRSLGDVDVQEAVRAYSNVRMLDITELSDSRGEAHVAKFMKSDGSQDCLHWCLPGVPDTWNHLLAAHLQAI